MKFLILALLSTAAFSLFSQDIDSVSTSNSFENTYQESNPTLTYRYDINSQIHNYSDNWDFDKDGKKDEVYFVGTGGAHLYYFLKVVLSTDNKPRDFTFVKSDFPILTATDTLNFSETPFGFVVTDLGKNQTPSIIVRLDDQSYYAIKKLFTKKKIKTKNIVISFENGSTVYDSL